MRTIVIHPDAIEGGWDLLEEDIISLNQSFVRRSGVVLPQNMEGRHGEFLRAAKGGKNIKEISKIMNISPRRARQILQEMLDDPTKIRGEIEIAKNALFQFESNELQQLKKSRRGRKPGKKTRGGAAGQAELFSGGGA